MKKLLIIFSLLAIQTTIAFAAELSFVQTKDAYSGLIVFDVMVDPEGEQVNAFSGTIIIPSNIVSVELVDTKDSIVPLWLTPPKVTEDSGAIFAEHQGTKVSFEGVVPGGFDGVRSPYYAGRRAGKLFTLILRPKAKGIGMLVFNDVYVLKNDGKATPAIVLTRIATVSISNIKNMPSSPNTGLSNSQKEYAEAEETTLDAYAVKNADMADNKWVLIIEDDGSRHTIVGYRVAESNSSITKDVPFYEWKEATSPYILSYQKRNRFVHVQAIYADGTRSTKVIRPVENASDELTAWRILIGIAIGAVIVYLLQKRHVLQAIFTHHKSSS